MQTAMGGIDHITLSWLRGVNRVWGPAVIGLTHAADHSSDDARYDLVFLCVVRRLGHQSASIFQSEQSVWETSCEHTTLHRYIELMAETKAQCKGCMHPGVPTQCVCVDSAKWENAPTARWEALSAHMLVALAYPRPAAGLPGA